MAPQTKAKISVNRRTAKYQKDQKDTIAKHGTATKPSSSTNAVKGDKKAVAASTKGKGVSPVPSVTSKASKDERKGKPKGPTLDVNATEYDGIWRQTKYQMASKPIHANDQNRIDHILRVFDLDSSYGPCVGMSRMERWKRAEAMDMDPPVEIKEILLTQQGLDDARYRENVLHTFAL